MNRESKSGAKLITYCRHLATYLHDGEVDKKGQPYILHLSRVADRVRKNPAISSRDHSIAAAWLHDSVENGHITIDILWSLLPNPTIIRIADLTRKKDETYSNYINRLLVTSDSRLIKIADIEDNLDSKRGPIPESLASRYYRALKRIEDRVNVHNRRER